MRLSSRKTRDDETHGQIIETVTKLFGIMSNYNFIIDLGKQGAISNS